MSVEDHSEAAIQGRGTPSCNEHRSPDKPIRQHGRRRDRGSRWSYPRLRASRSSADPVRDVGRDVCNGDPEDVAALRSRGRCRLGRNRHHRGRARPQGSMVTRGMIAQIGAASQAPRVGVRRPRRSTSSGKGRQGMPCWWIAIRETARFWRRLGSPKRSLDNARAAAGPCRPFWPGLLRLDQARRPWRRCWRVRMAPMPFADTCPLVDRQ